MPRVYTSESIESRFAKYVRKTSGCWLWTGCKNNMGYGQLFVVKKPSRVVRLAHRISWEIHNGAIPEGASVLHRCDTPLCVNPAHLFLGDQASNIADCVAKGRSPRGSKNGHAKLTEADVREIRSQASGVRGEQVMFAARYGVSPSAIAFVLNGRKWKHVHG